jgi:hypothetical protein
MYSEPTAPDRAVLLRRESRRQPQNDLIPKNSFAGLLDHRVKAAWSNNAGETVFIPCLLSTSISTLFEKVTPPEFSAHGFWHR